MNPIVSSANLAPGVSGVCCTRFTVQCLYYCTAPDPLVAVRWYSVQTLTAICIFCRCPESFHFDVFPKPRTRVLTCLNRSVLPVLPSG